jgi:hypothetical protein
MEARIDEKKPLLKKLSIKESHLKKLTVTEADQKVLAPYAAFTMYQLDEK